MSQTSLVTYDGFNFGANGIVLTRIDHLNMAQRQNQLEKIADQIGTVLVESTLGSKPIFLEGYYAGSSPANAQTMYDTLAAVLNRQERPLVLPHGTSTRKYTATPQNVIIQQPDGLNRLTFSFEFVVPSGLASSDTDIELFSTTIVSSTYTIPVNVIGSVDARPLITLNVGAVTGGENKTVSIRNARDLIGLTILRDWQSGDSIIIDSANYQLYINGELVHPTGRFPSWSAGSGAVYYADTFTTRSVDLTGTYKPRNL